MPDAVFNIPSEGPPVVSSSLDGDKELQDSFAATWDAVDAADAERSSKEVIPESPEPTVAVEPSVTSIDSQPLESTPKTVKTEFGSSKKKLSESTRAPSAEELNRDLDGPKAEEPKAETDEFEALEPHPASSEESRSHFSRLKQAAREFREKAKTYETKLSPVFQELGVAEGDVDGLASTIKQLKTQPGLPSQDLQELEYFRSRDKLKGLISSPVFNREYKKPVDDAYDAAIEMIAKYLPGDQEVKQREFIHPLKTEFRPGSKRHGEMTEAQWRNYIDAMQVDNLTKTAAWNKVVELKTLENRHDEKALEYATNKDSLEKLYAADKEDYDNQAIEYGKQYGNLVRDESEKLLNTPEMEPYRKIRDNDPERWKELNKRFEEILTDYNRGGPRAACKRTIEYIRMQEEVSELKRLKAENERLRRSVGLSRKVQDAPLKPSAGHQNNGKPQVSSPRLTSSRNPDWSNLPGGGN